MSTDEEAELEEELVSRARWILEHRGLWSPLYDWHATVGSSNGTAVLIIDDPLLGPYVSIRYPSDTLWCPVRADGGFVVREALSDALRVLRQAMVLDDLSDV